MKRIHEYNKAKPYVPFIFDFNAEARNSNGELMGFTGILRKVEMPKLNDDCFDERLRGIAENNLRIKDNGIFNRYDPQLSTSWDSDIYSNITGELINETIEKMRSAHILVGGRYHKRSELNKTRDGAYRDPNGHKLFAMNFVLSKINKGLDEDKKTQALQILKEILLEKK